MTTIIKETVDKERLIPFVKQAFINRNFGIEVSQKHAESVVNLIGDIPLESKDLTKYILEEVGKALIDAANNM